MRKKYINVCLITILFSLSIFNIRVLAANPLEYYYAIKPSSSEWVALETVDEKINACQIPASILCEMQTENLIEVVIGLSFIV